MSAITSDLCCFLIWIVVIASAVIALAWLTLKERRSQKIDDLPVLATCWSGTSAILKVNTPAVHGSS